jgi:hypothetical protein
MSSVAADYRFEHREAVIDFFSWPTFLVPHGDWRERKILSALAPVFGSTDETGPSGQLKTRIISFGYEGDTLPTLKSIGEVRLVVSRLSRLQPINFED